MALSPSSSRGIALADANTWAGNQTAPAFVASGLTGAVAASRYVGATASAAPAAGTFAVGDFVVDQTGKMYVCTVAGTPGTWIQVGVGAGPAGLLGSASITSAFTTTSDTAVQVTGLTATVTVPAGGRSVRVTVIARDVQNSASNSFAFVSLWDGVVGSGTQLGEAGAGGTTGGAAFPLALAAVVTPAAGSKTYNVGLTDAATGGTAKVDATAAGPALLLVEGV